MKNLKLILLIAAYSVAAYAFAATDDSLRLQSMPIELTANRVSSGLSEKPWQYFGKAKPSETMAELVTINCFQMDTTSVDVDYRIIDDEIWEYRLNGFLGADIIISSNNVTGISTIADQATPMSSGHYGEWEGYYKTWHFGGVNYGTPRDGRLVMSSNCWMFVAPGSGFNLARTDVYFDFVSDLIPSFKLLGSYSYVMAGPDETEVSFEVERSHDVDMAEVRLFKLLPRLEGSGGIIVHDTVSVERVKITPDNKITVKLSAGRGTYSMMAVGCDKYGTFGERRNIDILSNQRDESHQWKPLGKGLFLSNMFVMAWPNARPVWSEVEIEQATDIEGLYRAVNPFHQKVIGDCGAELHDMDFYLEFGPSLDCRDYLPVGVEMYVVNPVHVDNPDLSDGWFETNYGWFTLPGINNCSIVFASATEATATPQVKSVRYVVVPAADAAECSDLPALDAWFESGKYAIKTVEPSAEGKLAFDLGGYDGSLCMVVARGFDESAVVGSIQSEINYALDGWKKVGNADFTPTLNGFLSFSATLTPEVYVNPFKREMVRVLDPYKPLEGLDENLIYDFSVDRSVFLIAGAERPIYSCSMNSEIEEVGCHIGISGHPSDPDRPEYTLNYRFECQTNGAVRSGWSWDEMVDVDEWHQVFPRRYGNMLVFPERSVSIYALGAQDIGYIGNREGFSFYAPMRFAVNEDVAVAADGQSFVVGDDVVKLRVLVSDVLSRSGEITLEKFIADETLGEILMVKNGRSEELLRTQGTYRVLAVAYNDRDEVANAFEANMDLDLEQSSISDVVIGGDVSPEYFNLQGVKINKPEPGTVVIIKCGDTVSKAVVR